MSHKKLELCPFCGSKAELTCGCIPCTHIKEYEICCSNLNCGIRTGSDYQNKQEVIDIWNIRIGAETNERAN